MTNVPCLGLPLTHEFVPRGLSNVRGGCGASLALLSLWGSRLPPRPSPGLRPAVSGEKSHVRPREDAIKPLASF